LILERWREYFEELFKQPPLSVKVGSDFTTSSSVETPSIEGGRFTVEDLQKAIKSLSDWKAPGDDGITNEMIKGLTGENSFGATLRLLNHIQQTNNLPPSWHDSIICPLPKTGDLSDPNNYRGISLMSCVGKLYTRVLGMKISDFMESNKLLCPEQIGFRQERRCIEHILVLREALRRRAHVGKTTYGIFIDFRKAYDTVPREYLFEKMRQYNIPEDLINNVRHYYEISHGRVRLGDLFSEKFNIEMGVRQGCSMSPLLFSIFINDILDEIKQLKLGLNVPGIEKLLSGLLYADDLIALVDHPEQLQPLLDCITRWANRWGMGVNASKCAIVCFGPDHEGATERLKQSTYVIGGSNIPIATSYKYLGCIFQSDLSWNLELKNREEAGRKALFANRAVFQSKFISVGIKLNLIKSLIIPVVLYGAEIWFENREQMKKIDEIYFKALRWATNSNKLVPKVALLYEANVKPLWLTIIGRVAKVLLKWDMTDKSLTSSYWIKDFVNPKCVVVNRKWTWRRYALQSLGKIDLDIISIIKSAIDNKSSDDATIPPPKLVIKKGIDDYFKRWLKVQMGKCETLNSLSMELEKTEDLQKQKYLYVNDHMAVRSLFLARTKSLPLNGRISWMTGTKVCPCCGNENETLFHFLLECPAYVIPRREWISKWLKYATNEEREKFVGGTQNTQAQMLIWNHFEFDATLNVKVIKSCMATRLKALKAMYLQRIQHIPGGYALRVCHINAHTDME
jgi:hypothetical protein